MSETVEETVTETEEAPEVAPDETADTPEPDEESPDGEESDALGDDEEPITEEAVAAAQGDTVPGEVPDGMSPEQMEKEFKRVDRAAVRWNDTVVEFIASTEQPIIRCGCCLPGMPGFLFSPAAQAPTEDQVKFARALAGMPEQPPLVQAPNARTCPACEGWGDVLTGSKRNDQVKMRCLTCQGRGFVGDGSLTNGSPAPTPGALQLAPLEAVDVAPDDAPPTDPWGRAPSHPGYMIMPHAGMADELKPPNWQG